MTWLKETITARHWSGLAVGLIGVLLVLGPKLDIADSGINPTTITACMFAVLGISAGTIYQKYFATTLDLRTGTALQYVGAFIPTVLFALMFESFEINWNGESVFALIWLCAAAKGIVPHSAKILGKVYWITELLGRWSMVDIFVVAILVTMVQLGNYMVVTPGPGALAFAGVVILTMFAAMSFDPKLLWDQLEREAAEAESEKNTERE